MTMSLLIGLFIISTPFLSKRYSQKGLYYAWLILVLGLIIPFRPQWSNAIVSVELPMDNTNVSAYMMNMLGDTPSSGQGAYNATNRITNIATSYDATSGLFSNISMWHIVGVVWLTGVMVFLIFHIIRHFRFVKMVRRWSESINDKSVLRLYQSVKSEMGIRRWIPLSLCSCVGSPMMIGVIQPKIYLPSVNMSKEELSFVLRHELVHYKRRDLLYKYLVLIASALHWFNPVVYLMMKSIDRLCEASCDVEVVRSVDIDIRLPYSKTIIEVAKHQSKLRTTLSTSFYGGKKGMKNRIVSIMDTNKKKTGVAILSCAMILTMATGTVLAGEIVESDMTIPDLTVSDSLTDEPVTSDVTAEVGVGLEPVENHLEGGLYDVNVAQDRNGYVMSVMNSLPMFEEAGLSAFAKQHDGSRILLPTHLPEGFAFSYAHFPLGERHYFRAVIDSFDALNFVYALNCDEELFPEWFSGIVGYEEPTMPDYVTYFIYAQDNFDENYLPEGFQWEKVIPTPDNGFLRIYYTNGEEFIQLWIICHKEAPEEIWRRRALYCCETASGSEFEININGMRGFATTSAFETASGEQSDQEVLCLVRVRLRDAENGVSYWFITRTDFSVTIDDLILMAESLTYKIY